MRIFFSFVSKSGSFEALVANFLVSLCAASHLVERRLSSYKLCLTRGCRSQIEVPIQPNVSLLELVRPGVRMIPHPLWTEPCYLVLVREHVWLRYLLLPCKGQGARWANEQMLSCSQDVSVSAKAV